MFKIKKTDSEINLIVALGNVGKSYAKTRHNAGFLFADALEKFFKEKGVMFTTQQNKLYEAIIFPTLNLHVIKPQTMMNNSGLAVNKYIRMNEGERFKPAMLLVHDDLDLHLGDYKLQLGKSPKLHNGVKSVEEHLGGLKEFWRLRIGIDNRTIIEREPGLEYVLKTFSSSELTELNVLYGKLIQDEFTFI